MSTPDFFGWNFKRHALECLYDNLAMLSKMGVTVDRNAMDMWYLFNKRILLDDNLKNWPSGVQSTGET